MLIANRATLGLIAFLVAFGTPEVAIAAAIFMAKNRRPALIAGALVGLALTAYWSFVAVDELQRGSKALGHAILVYPLVAAGATVTALVGLYGERRQSRRSRDIARR